jgi:hypothetical protein
LGQGKAMTTFTMRVVKGDFIVMGPDIAAMKFKNRRDAKKWLQGAPSRSPIIEIGPASADYRKAYLLSFV